MKNFSLIIISLLFFFACSSKKNLSIKESNISEEQYYSTFTEATKHALLGNYKNALQLYYFCINEFPDRAASYYQVSNIFYTVKDLNNAKAYGIKAVERDDSNKWYLLHLASIYQIEQNADSLIILYEKITKLTDNPEYKYNLALFYSAKGNYNKSMAIVNELENQLDGSREIFLIKHRNYAAMNYQDSAISELEELIYFFPEQYENYGMLAEYFSEINQYDNSRKVYVELLNSHPNNGLANLSFGDFFIKQGLKDSALFYYKRGFAADDIVLDDKVAVLYNFISDRNYILHDTVFVVSLIDVLKDKYDDYRPYTLSAEFYIKQQNYKIAAEELKNAISFGADNYIVWEQYIMISNFIGNHKDVGNIYEEALIKFPGEINIYIFAGYSLYDLKMYKKIIALESDGLAIEEVELDQKVQFLNLLADAYRGINNFVKSDSIFDEILVLDPNNLLIRNNYSYYLSIRSHNLEKAEELSRLTVNKEPKNATYLDTYGWILFKMGRAKDALKYVEAAIRYGAYNNGEVLDHYGDIMFNLLRYTEAIEAWSTAIKNDNSLKELLNTKISEANDLLKNE